MNKQEIEELIPQLNKEESKDPISLIKDRDVYYEKLMEIYQEANEEVRVIARGLEDKKRGFDVLSSAKKAIKRGVECRIIAPISDENKKRAAQCREAGINIRNYPIYGLRVAIADNKLAYLAIVDDRLPYNRATITVRSKEFL